MQSKTCDGNSVTNVFTTAAGQKSVDVGYGLWKTGNKKKCDQEKNTVLLPDDISKCIVVEGKFSRHIQCHVVTKNTTSNLLAGSIVPVVKPTQETRTAKRQTLDRKSHTASNSKLKQSEISRPIDTVVPAPFGGINTSGAAVLGNRPSSNSDSVTGENLEGEDSDIKPQQHQKKKTKWNGRRSYMSSRRSSRKRSRIRDVDDDTI